ncbi:DUF4062 domain-containing protein [Naasia sp. SYSU D00057]|uniref:DUF4062 domain-containing protein n=1 Tax=Naasia sp. SYSU D00057 TaxID=2817380 RepID=UPI001B304CEB|nr:DUF4062 domain-containing protein [Naasia sp. SYSU D00057]
MSDTASSSRVRIRTPDQRLRVFVSSTLGELAAERKAARRAIERLSAAAVMFELGARPHPPRSLYRAYLEQSDIFVGIYWQKYGWVAPGETVSGLEDEYNLAPSRMPKLMYVKAGDGPREPGLERLLDRIRDDDTASYKHFRDARELSRLLVTDLAVLLAERFDDSRVPAASSSPAPPVQGRETPVTSLPTPLTELFGREQDVDGVAEMLRSPDMRLVTLTGPGGIGKTRLAIEAARALAAEVGEVAFVPLAAVDDATQVPNAMAHALGVLDTGDAPLGQKLALSLGSRHMLMVLDNFEQVVGAAPLVSRLLAAAPQLKVIVTSRVLLRIGGEHTYQVNPLGLPGEDREADSPAQVQAPSVDLFIERARSVKPDLELTAENLTAIKQIVRRLEGVPLAIELAAARTSLLAPPTLLDRLQHQLPVLAGGQRDAPVRQQTVRDTIEWSTRLLGEHEQNLLWRLGVFTGRFSLNGAEAVAESGVTPFDLLESLVDASLIRQQERKGATFFQLLATVREYATERLERQGHQAEVRDLHARYYANWALALAPDLTGPRQLQTITALSDEQENLRTALRHLLDTHQWDLATELAVRLYTYWWIAGLLGEARSWVNEVIAAGEAASKHSRAAALWIRSFLGLMLGAGEEVVRDLDESLQLLTASGDRDRQASVLSLLGFAYALSHPAEVQSGQELIRQGMSMMSEAGNTRPPGDLWTQAFSPLIPLGRIELARGNFEAASELFEQALRFSNQVEDDFARTFPLNHLGWTRLLAGRVAEAAPLMERQLDLSLGLGHEQGVAYGLECFVGVAHALGQTENAGLLYGAVRAIRDRLGLANVNDEAVLPIVDSIRNSPSGPEFERAVQRGRVLPRGEVIALARKVSSAAAAMAPAPAAST